MPTNRRYRARRRRPEVSEALFRVIAGKPLPEEADTLIEWKYFTTDEQRVAAIKAAKAAGVKVAPPPPLPTCDPVRAYAEKVRDGEIIAGPLVRLACARHLRDLEDGPRRGLAWDLAAAMRAIEFFPDVLRLAEGEHAGKPFTLEPAQAFIVGSLHGWRAPDGYRRFRTAYAEEGKGNGKSPLAGGLAIYAMVADGEPGAHCYAGAVTRDQAAILFGDAVNMVDASPPLSARIVKSGKRAVHKLAHPQTNSFFRPVSSEGKGLDGKRVHFAALDEIHEHPSAVVVDKMRAGTKGRRQALIFEITNSGFDKTTICWQHHEYSERVLRGIVNDDSWFAYVCGLDEGDDWRDESVWLKANPLLDVSITRKYLREQVREAQGMPAKQGIVRRLNFCQWTENAAPWIEPELWEACQADLKLEDYADESAHCAIDLSGRRDLTSFGQAFWRGDELHAFLKYWTPAEGIAEREDRDHANYRDWRDRGYLLTTPGRSVDYDFVAADIIKTSEQFQIEEISFDRWRVDFLVKAFDGLGAETYIGKPDDDARQPGLRLIPHGQGFKDFGPAVEALMEVISNRKLKVQRNPVTLMCAANATLEMDPAGAQKFNKRKSTGRIDGMTVLAMMVGRAMVAPKLEESSVIAFWA